MMLIRVRVGPSRIHGLGLFTVAPAPAGTPVWRFEPGFDQVFPPTAYAALPALVQAHLRWFGFARAEDGAWVLSGDHACFMNHSTSPNTGAGDTQAGAVTTVALRDLAAGEELTCDYRTFDAEAARKLEVAGCGG